MADRARYRRSPRDVASALARMKKAMREFPNGRVVAGVVDINDDQVTHRIGGVDFEPIHWVALADECLAFAALKMAKMPDVADLFARIETARAALGFEDYGSAS